MLFESMRQTGGSFSVGTVLAPMLGASAKTVAPTISGFLFSALKQQEPSTQVIPSPSKRDSTVADTLGFGVFPPVIALQTALAPSTRNRIGAQLASSVMGSLVADQYLRGCTSGERVPTHRGSVDSTSGGGIKMTTAVEGAGIFLAASLVSRRVTPGVVKAAEKLLPSLTHSGKQALSSGSDTTFLAGAAVLAKKHIRESKESSPPQSDDSDRPSSHSPSVI